MKQVRARIGGAVSGLRTRLAGHWPPTRRQVLTAVVVGVVVPWGLWERCGVRGCPNVETLAAYRPGGASVLLDRDGEEFARLSPVSRDLVPLEDLPEHVPAAFLAVEDRRFHEHDGVDWRRAGGSLLANVRAGGIREGFSTITMQLARNIFPRRLPGEERTIRRKLLEVRVAGDIEDRFAKDEILELYLNHIYFGGSLYGIEAAARGYFDRPASDLTLAQAATLAAMPKAPNAYNPRTHPERARERRDLVLSLMAEQGRTSEDEAARARAQAVAVGPERPPPEREIPEAPWFVQAVRRGLEEALGDALYAAPLRIHTTLDRGAQRAAEAALAEQFRRVEAGRYGRFEGVRPGGADAVDSTGTHYLQGAVVVIDPHTGGVLALVGGRDYGDSPFDRATQGRRPVGSAFKPFVYAAALQDGYAPSQRLVDEPLRMELEGGEVWEPENFDGTFRGEMTMREAAVQSNNVATVRLALAVGLGDVADAAHDAGIERDLPELPSLALGSVEMSLLELTAAYLPFAHQGERRRPTLVTRVETEDGEGVWEADDDADEVLDPAVAWLVTDFLRDAVDSGTGTGVRQAGYGGPAAGKTGTTNDGMDTWFVGYTPDLVTGVWVGFDHPRTIVDRATGGRIAAPVWARTVSGAYRHRPASQWPEPPDGVVERDVDPVSGLVLAEECRPAGGAEPRKEIFLEGEVPASVCPEGGKPGLLARVGSSLRNFFHRAGGWIGGLFSDEEEEEERREQERYLGAPRLPRAEEVRTPVVEEDSLLLEELRIRLDSIPLEDLSVPRDSLLLPPGDTALPPGADAPPDTAASPPDTAPRPRRPPADPPGRPPPDTARRPPPDTSRGAPPETSGPPPPPDTTSRGSAAPR